MGYNDCMRSVFEKYPYSKYLLFWPIYGIVFLLMEKALVVDHYHTIHIFLDDHIPFLEIFFIPYVLWYFYLLFIHVYTLKYDTESFVKLMKYLISTFSVAMAICFVFPNCQELRPSEFPRNNFLTDCVMILYTVDTNTNVFPSMHVIGSFGVLFAAINSKGLDTAPVRTLFWFITIIICSSTVFIKQHSLLDVFAGIVISVIAYCLIYKRRPV